MDILVLHTFSLFFFFWFSSDEGVLMLYIIIFRPVIWPVTHYNVCMCDSLSQVTVSGERCVSIYLQENSKVKIKAY